MLERTRGRRADYSDESIAVMRQELLRQCGESVARRMDDCPNNKLKYRYAKTMLGGSALRRAQWHCIECCGYSINEAKKCISRSCALWALYPGKYQKETPTNDQD